MKQRIYAIAATITAIVIASATAATAQGVPEGLAGTPSAISATGRDSAIVIIDGRVSTPAAMQALNAGQIKEFSVYMMGKTQLMQITTIDGTRGDGAPLIMVNGLEIDSLPQVRQEYVRTVTAMQPDKATKTYGTRGGHGAVMITMHPTYNGMPISLRDALSGNERKDSTEWLKVTRAIGARKADATDEFSLRDSPSPQPTTGKPLILGRADGNETIYLIPDLNKVKPDDIASVVVFKDKSASLLDAYGDTSGGVILVTFKKGRMPLSAVVKAGEK